MARSIAKAGNPVTVTVVPELGIDYSAPAAAISDNALRVSSNGYYMPGSRKWRSRPGVSCVLTEANKFSSRVDVMRPHYNGTSTYLVVASGGKLYRIDSSTLSGGAGSRVFTEIGDLSGQDIKPGLCTFNTTLFVADRGNLNLRYWDSSGVYGEVTNGPAYPSVVVEARNRLWANSTTDADAIYGSPAEWTSTTFDEAGYVVLRAGYGDGMNVCALASGPGGNDLIIAKRNKDRGGAHTRRLNLEDPSPANWYITDPLATNAAQDNPYAMTQAFNDTWFIGDDGIYDLVGVQKYGNINVGNLGDKINPLMKVSEDISAEEISYNEVLGCVFLVLKRTAIYVYTPWNNAFTQWDFKGEYITSVCTFDKKTYLGTESGRIYVVNTDNSVNTSVGYDELSYGTLTPFSSTFRTKSFAFGGYEAMVRRCVLSMTPLQAGTGNVVVVDESSNVYPIFDWTQSDNVLRIGGDWAQNTKIGGTEASLKKLGTIGNEPEVRRGFGGPRSDSLSFQVYFTAGARSEVAYFSADIRGNLGV